jgi:mannose-6-phosphate isomerase-like protein (cupin superfamily)
MSDYTVRSLEEVPDLLGDDYPGEMRMFTQPLGNEQVAFTYRRMPAQTGGKGGYGHRHKTQEEIYFVVAGRLQFKLDEDVIDVDGGSAVRVAPHVARSVWNEGPDDAQLLIFSLRVANVDEDAEIVEDFWPK